MQNVTNFVLGHKQRARREVAFLFKPGSHPHPCWLGFKGNAEYETAAANIFRTDFNQPDDVDGYCLFLTYPPTEMCMGLAWRGHTKRVYWHTTSGIKCRQAYPHPYPELLHNSIDDLLANWGNPTVIRGGNYRGNDELSRKLSFGIRNVNSPIPTTSTQARDKAFMKVVSGLIGSSWNEKVPKRERLGVNSRRPFGNNIGGVLVDNNTNRIIGWGLNMKHLNKCYHGETLMLLHYLRANNTNTIPTGSILYTSLEPCHMCSGFITSVGRNIRVVSGQPDEGACDQSALRRRVNGCSLHGHDMQDPIYLEILRGRKGMIPFLFGADSRGHFQGKSNVSSRNIVEQAVGIKHTDNNELSFL